MGGGSVDDRSVKDVQPPRLPPGRQLYDPLNGFRVGGFTGAIVGTLAAVAAGVAYLWVAFAGAAVGGAIGYWSERRKLHRVPPDGSAARR